VRFTGEPSVLAVGGAQDRVAVPVPRGKLLEVFESPPPLPPQPTRIVRRNARGRKPWKRLCFR
jgi:hypothetical protein